MKWWVTWLVGSHEVVCHLARGKSCVDMEFIEDGGLELFGGRSKEEKNLESG